MVKKKYDPTKNVMKVIQMGLQERVFNSMKKGQSVAALTRELNDEGIVITQQSIRKFIKKSKDAQRQVIKQDLKAVEEFKELAMDYQKAIKDILAEVEQVKNEARDEKDMATYNQLIGRLYQGIELIAKLTGDLKERQQVDINIIYQEITQDIERRFVGSRDKIWNTKIIDVEARVKEEDEVVAARIRE